MLVILLSCVRVGFRMETVGMQQRQEPEKCLSFNSDNWTIPGQSCIAAQTGEWFCSSMRFRDMLATGPSASWMTNFGPGTTNEHRRHKTCTSRGISLRGGGVEKLSSLQWVSMESISGCVSLLSASVFGFLQRMTPSFLSSTCLFPISIFHFSHVHIRCRGGNRIWITVLVPVWRTSELVLKVNRFKLRLLRVVEGVLS